MLAPSGLVAKDPVVLSPFSSANLQTHFSSPWARIEEGGDSNGDFNQGSSGKYIYLCSESLGGSASITDLKVQASSSASSCPSGYSTVQGTNGNADFNEGHGGKYVYVCYKADSTSLAAVPVGSSQIAFGLVGLVAFTAGVMKTYKAHSSNYKPLLDNQLAHSSA